MSRAVAFLLACLLASCRNSAPTTSQPPESSARTPPSASPASSSSGSATAPSNAFRHAAVSKEEKVCKAGECFCAAPLGCGGDKPCITYDENVAAFRTALKGVGSGKDRRTVTCNHAEVGTCGDFRYFFFDGDIYRTELRFFDKQGNSVGEIARTDYAEYCGGTASQRVRGAIPSCTLAPSELICGKASDLNRLIASMPF